MKPQERRLCVAWRRRQCQLKECKQRFVLAHCGPLLGPDKLACVESAKGKCLVHGEAGCVAPYLLWSNISHTHGRTPLRRRPVVCVHALMCAWVRLRLLSECKAKTMKSCQVDRENVRRKTGMDRAGYFCE